MRLADDLVVRLRSYSSRTVDPQRNREAETAAEQEDSSNTYWEEEFEGAPCAMKDTVSTKNNPENR